MKQAIISFYPGGIAFLCIFFFFSCSRRNIDVPGSLVPSTAAEDNRLPQLKVLVAGHQRVLHLKAFGSPSNPPLFVLPGGPGADFRLLLPLSALADSFYVVMWDPRGAGLSERVTKEELTIESLTEEISEVKTQLSPSRRVSVIGHSFGGNTMARFASENPGAVDRVILIEPGGLNPGRKVSYNGGAISFFDGQNFFWTNELLSSSDHAAADFKAIDLLPKASHNFTCDHSVANPYPLWRFGTYQYHILQKKIRSLPDGFLWAPHLANFSRPISIIAGTCGAASENYQRQANLPDLPAAQLIIIKGAGHISLFTSYAGQLLNAIRNCLH